MKKDIKTLELIVKKRLNWDFLGAYNTAFKWTWLIFRDLRQYIVGDSIKKIDWRASARLNELQVKNFEEERDLKVFFLLDVSSSMDVASEEKSKKDLLFELFFTLAHSVIRWRDKFWALIYDNKNSKFVDFSAWEENIIKIVSIIDEFFQGNNKLDWNETINAFKQLEKLKINNSLIFVLSDKMQMDKSIFKLMWVLNEIVYINIFDYFENNLSNDNFVLDLSFKNKFISYFSFDKNKKQEYKKLRTEKINDFKLSLRKIGIDYINLDTKTDIFRTLLIYFNKKSWF